jgi:hypothetical protein
MSNGWTYQGGWKWCVNCTGLFFAGNPSQGVCPVEQRPHSADLSGTYLLRLGGESAPPGNTGPPLNVNYSGQQGDWRWCHKCQGLFFAGNPSQGVCPADYLPHDGSQSGHYAIVFDDGASLIGQTNWRWCPKCQGLFFAGHTDWGLCPADHGILALRANQHDADQSGQYQLEPEPPPIP